MKFELLFCSALAVLLSTAGVAADECGLRHDSARELDDCEQICIDFSKAGNGTTLKHGDYVKREWYETFRMTVEASTTTGGYTPNGMARIYDTTQQGADPDLESPNEKCGGHGVGAGGEPSGDGPNCNPDGEGNVLIIQESNKEEPDDNGKGGIMKFDFECPAYELRSIGLIDVETREQAFFEIYEVDKGAPTIQKIAGKGGNSIQEELFDGDKVKNITGVNIVASNSFGVRSICFCPDRECIDTGSRTGPPLPPAILPPSKTPTAAPSSVTRPTSPPTIRRPTTAPSPPTAPTTPTAAPSPVTRPTSRPTVRRPTTAPSPPTAPTTPTAAPSSVTRPTSRPTVRRPTIVPSAPTGPTPKPVLSAEKECSVSNPPSKCGCDANGFKGIERAVAAAAGPDITQIRICPGTWLFSGPIDLTGKMIEFSCPSRKCTLVGEDDLPSGGIFRSLGGHNLVFRNLVFRKGSIGALVLLSDDDVDANDSAVFGGCTFEDNVGGAVYQTMGRTFFNQCTFQKNTRSTQVGGVYTLQEGTAGFFKCNFLDNAASSDGGVMFQEGGTSNFDTCKFYRNTAKDGDGGVAYLKGGATSNFQECDFRNNESAQGRNVGGVASTCHFQNNAANKGDGIVTAECRTDIEDVIVTPAAVCVGQPVTIEVQATAGTQVRIEGVGGMSRVMQFNVQPGEMPVSIAAVGPTGHQIEHTVWVTIEDCGGPSAPSPLIGSSLSSASPNLVHLFVRNTEVFGIGASFLWSVDGQDIGAKTGVLTHDFGTRMRSAGAEAAFTIGVLVVGGPSDGAFGSKTISMFNPYSFFKGQGEFRLPTTASAVNEEPAGSTMVSVVIENPEETDALLSAVRVGFGSCDLSEATPYQQNPTESIRVPARGKVAHGVELKSLPALTCMIELLWSGTIGTRMARASVVVPVSSAVATSDVVRLSDPATVQELNELVDLGTIPPTGVSFSKLDEFVNQGVLAKRPSLEGRASPLAKGTATSGSELGDTCLPGDTPPHPGYVCAPSGQLDAHGSRIVNAQKGDALLGRSCGVIGGLLSSLSPPQHYSHAGIFVDNGAHVRHSYASEQRLRDYPNDGFLGLPTEGLQEHVLKYFFPGTITSSIREILSGKRIPDRDGHIYEVKGFNRDPAVCDDSQEMVPSLVVKPPPEYDAQVRPLLHKAADAALKIDGHYRLYAFTDGRIINNPAYAAPPDATRTWDVAGTVPSMCSLFVWKALKDAGATLNPRTDANNADAESTRGAPDGMFYYSKEKRLQAAKWLHSYVYKLAQDEDIWGLGERFGDAPDDAANQVTNCFVSDSCSKSAKDSRAWEEPGPGITVSPSDILYWDSPAHGGVYGYSEPAIFIDGYITIEHRWQVDVQTGTVKGTVVGKDGLPIAGATVSIATLPEPVTTTADGSFVFYPVPVGVVIVDVQASINGQVAFTQTAVSVTAGGTTDVTIVPKIRKRHIIMWGTMIIKDDETTKDKFYYRRFYATVDVEPGREERSKTIKVPCAGNEIRVELTLTVVLKDDNTVQVDVLQKLFEGTSCDTKDHEKEADAKITISLAEDSYQPQTLDSDASGFGEDYAHTNLVIVNGDLQTREWSGSVSGTLWVKDRNKGFRDDRHSTLNIDYPFALSTAKNHVEKSWQTCAGGEARGEIDAHFLLLPDGTLAVHTHHRLYEGGSCNTNDLEDKGLWHKLIPAGTETEFVVNLDNDGDDKSKATLTIKNDGLKPIAKPTKKHAQLPHSGG